MSKHVHVYVSLERDKSGYPPFEVEELDASLEKGDRFRIESIPVFVYGLARFDVVKIVRVDGDARLWVERPLEASGHWTVRILPRDRLGLETVAGEFRAQGHHSYATPFGLVAVDVAPAADVSAVMRRLEKGRESGAWDFDIGVQPAPGE